MGPTTNTVRDHNYESQTIGTHGKVNATYIVNETNITGTVKDYTYEKRKVDGDYKDIEGVTLVSNSNGCIGRGCL